MPVWRGFITGTRLLRWALCRPPKVPAVLGIPLAGHRIDAPDRPQDGKERSRARCLARVGMQSGGFHFSRTAILGSGCDPRCASWPLDRELLLQRVTLERSDCHADWRYLC